MTAPRKRSRPLLTLIANSQEWHSRSLESVLGPHGYAVLRAYTGKQAVERAETALLNAGRGAPPLALAALAAARGAIERGATAEARAALQPLLVRRFAGKGPGA